MKTADNAGLCQVIEAIGLPAVLEQCAEELAELTQAALTLDQSIVILTWGKMDASGNIPLALQLNHALVDGLHVGRFHRALTGFLTAPASL